MANVVRREEVHAPQEIQTGELYVIMREDQRTGKIRESIVRAVSKGEQLADPIVRKEIFGSYGLDRGDWIFRAVLLVCNGEPLEREDREIIPIGLAQKEWICKHILHLIVQNEQREEGGNC